MTKRIDIVDAPKEFKRYLGRSEAHLKNAVAKGITNYMPKLVADTPVDTGQLSQSWDMDIREKEILLGNYAPHSPINELGARPFNPPIQPLLAWAKRVLKSSSQPPDYDEEVRGLAYGVQKKIRKEGMKPRNTLKEALPKIIEEIKLELSEVDLNKPYDGAEEFDGPSF